jgi:hypothetical protein
MVATFRFYVTVQLYTAVLVRSYRRVQRTVSFTLHEISKDRATHTIQSRLMASTPGIQDKLTLYTGPRARADWRSCE